MLVLFVSLDNDVGSDVDVGDDVDVDVDVVDDDDVVDDVDVVDEVDVDVDFDVDDNVLFFISCGRKVPFLAFSVLIIGSQVSWSLNSEEILGKESSVWKM